MNTDLAAYTVFLLLSDHEGVQDHQRKLTSFVRELDEADAVNHVVLAERAFQRMADDMARGLTRGGFTMALAARIRDLRGEPSI